jgi:hypothetical protein
MPLPVIIFSALTALALVLPPVMRLFTPAGR